MPSNRLGDRRAAGGATCLLTHACGAPTHRLATRLRGAFQSRRVRLLVDPFDPGDDLGIRIDALAIDSLLFLFSPESFSSSWCRREIDAARGHGLPLFTVRLRGEVPEEFQARLYPDLTILRRASFGKEIGKLARGIRIRSLFYQQTRDLVASPLDLDESFRVAQGIADQAVDDPTLVAEFLPQLKRQYPLIQNPSAQSWVATAIGRTGTREAASILLELLERHHRHPLARHGVTRALELISQELSGDPIVAEIHGALRPPIQQEKEDGKP